MRADSMPESDTEESGLVDARAVDLQRSVLEWLEARTPAATAVPMVLPSRGAGDERSCLDIPLKIRAALLGTEAINDASSATRRCGTNRLHHQRISHASGYNVGAG